MNIVTYLLLILSAVLAYVTFWYFRGQFLKRLDVADEAWGLAQPYIIIVAILLVRNFSLVSLVLLALTMIWGVRLFWHLYVRHKKGPEDQRYVEMKANWTKFPRVKSYVFVFLIQGALMLLLSVASVIAIFYKSPINNWLWIGLIVWIIGYICEFIADKQLASFISDPKNRGKIMTKGLWQYSRHPNYFGEVTMWWGIFIICFGQTHALFALVSPITITILILFVSGLPLAEKSFKGRQDWEDYKAKTSPLVPWFPKK